MENVYYISSSTKNPKFKDKTFDIRKGPTVEINCDQLFYNTSAPHVFNMVTKYINVQDNVGGFCNL